MLAQKITFDLMQSKLDDIRVVQGDSCREIQFEGSDLEGVLSYEDYTYEFDLMKSDGTFVIQTLSAGILIPTEQMEVITGTHYYSVKIKDADNELVYSGQGAFIVDDNVITEDAIESIAEVNGLVFPDDFLTTEDQFAQIDDNIISSSSVWSSYKTNQEIINAIESVKHVYSTTEIIVGTWIDGSIIYEKTYDIGYLTSSNKTIAHGISGFGHIIQVYGYVTNGTYDFPLPYATTDSYSCIGVTVNRTNINIYSYDRSDYHGYVTIQYTKI